MDNDNEFHKQGGEAIEIGDDNDFDSEEEPDDDNVDDNKDNEEEDDESVTVWLDFKIHHFQKRFDFYSAQTE